MTDLFLGIVLFIALVLLLGITLVNEWKIVLKYSHFFNRSNKFSPKVVEQQTVSCGIEVQGGMRNWFYFAAQMTKVFSTHRFLW